LLTTLAKREENTLVTWERAGCGTSLTKRKRKIARKVVSGPRMSKKEQVRKKTKGHKGFSPRKKNGAVGNLRSPGRHAVGVLRGVGRHVKTKKKLQKKNQRVWEMPQQRGLRKGGDMN